MINETKHHLLALLSVFWFHTILFVFVLCTYFCHYGEWQFSMEGFFSLQFFFFNHLPFLPCLLEWFVLATLFFSLLHTGISHRCVACVTPLLLSRDRSKAGALTTLPVCWGRNQTRLRSGINFSQVKPSELFLAQGFFVWQDEFPRCHCCVFRMCWVMCCFFPSFNVC